MKVGKIFTFMKISKFCNYFIQISLNANDTTAILGTTVLIMTLLITAILTTLNTSNVAYNDITYNWVYL